MRNVSKLNSDVSSYLEMSWALLTQLVKMIKLFPWMQSNKSQELPFMAALAKEMHLDKLTPECDRRAIEGVRSPIVNSSGEIVGYRVKYSDELLIFRLRMLDPSYRDGFKIKPARGSSGNDGLVFDSPELRELYRKIAQLIGGGKEEAR